MANKLSSLLRKVFLGSLAGLAASHADAATGTYPDFDINEGDDKTESLFKKRTDLSPKLILKKTDNDGWSFLAHRSHRSHSSHRSHMSHYSGSSGSGRTTTTPRSGNNPGTGTHYNSGGTNTNTGTAALHLGARTLKRGMSGTDVTELVNILLKKRYLQLNGGTVATGTYTYDETVEDAVKKFQKDNGLTSDGICGSTTIYYLKNK